MSRAVVSVVALCAIVVGSFAVDTTIIQPIRPRGDELALIFVPGANIKEDAYASTAKALQEGSALRVWAVLTGNYTKGLPNQKELKEAVDGAIKGLKTAGMKSENYVGVGHGMGGRVVSSYAKNGPLKAVVLLGSYINRATKLRDYPKPLLTLSGELDGFTRITRVALDFGQLQEEATRNKSALYRTPVVNIKGSCHAQFASGQMPAEIQKYDLQPDVTEQEAHDTAGRYAGHFLAVTFSTVKSKVEEAKRQIDHDLKESALRFQPLLNAKYLDIAGKSSPWAHMSQARLAGKLVARTTIYNKVLKTSAFVKSKPSIEKLGKGVVINTTALVIYEPNPRDMPVFKESPREVDIKMESRNAIKKALNVTDSEDFEETEASKGKTPTCRSLNELALRLALRNSTTQANERYRRRGRPLTFADDLKLSTEQLWSRTPLKMVENDKGLHVQAIALYTNVTNPVASGLHYCKIISPYRAMEWVNVDSLRKHKP